MIKIIPIQDKGEQERLCGLCGAEYLPNALAYAGYDGETFACVAQFSIKNSFTELYNLSPVSGAPENKDVTLLCGRAALNFAYTLGIMAARCAVPEPERLPLYKEIGFKLDGERMTCDLKNLFAGHCHG